MTFFTRRGVIAGSAAAALWPLVRVASATEPGLRTRVVVVGAGILGTSLAYHLATLGADVIVVEKEPGPGLGCTQGAFAMLIADRAEGPADLSALYGLAVLDWRRLEAELEGQIAIQWGGMLRWAEPGTTAEALLESVRSARAFGAAVEEVDAVRFSQLAPGVTAGPLGSAVFHPQYGTLNPLQATMELARAATQRGVRFHFRREVHSFRADTAGVVRAISTGQGEISGDVFVLAAGAGSPQLAQTAGANMAINIVSGTLAHTRPHRRVLHRVLNGPAGSIKQDPDGRIVTGLDYRPGAAVTDTSAAYGESLLAAATTMAPQIRGARLERMTLGFVPIPADGRPIVGFNAAPANLYTLVTMSGITMAPLLGRLAATEIVQRTPVALLEGYRPDRFG